MGVKKYNNNAFSTLAAAITTSSQTSITLQTGHGNRFPVVNQGGSGTDSALVTLQNSAGTIEIVNVARRDTGVDVLTIGVPGTATASASGRGLESTTATTWAIGDVVEQRITAGELTEFLITGGALGTPASGTVTNLTGTASININGTVGATTPGSGAFTTGTFSSTLAAGATTITGAATISTTLGVTGITTLGAAIVGPASATVFNTVSTTVNAFGAATTLNIGAATGTLTVANTTLAAKAITASTTLGVTGVTTLSSTLNVAGTTKITSGTLAANSSSSVFAVGVDTQDYVKGYFTGTVNGTSGGGFAVGVGFFGTFDSGSTSYGSSFYSGPNTAAGAYTIGNANHIWLRDWNKGAGSSITYQRGILIDDQTGGGTGNRGVESNVLSGSGKWNIFAGGTADNHFLGAIRQGSANPEQVAGTQSNSSFLTTSAVWALALLNNGATPYGLGIAHNTDSNGTGNEFMYCTGAGTLRMSVRSNGGVCNVQANDANTSDVRLKKNIELAGNYLDKICAIPVKTYLYKDQTDEFLNLGVIAQDVEAVAPELIDSGGFGETPEDGIPLKAVYQTDLQFALMKAIQELAAKVAQLEAA